MPTLPAFDEQQALRAHTYLATQVAEMLGRKFEEGDWSKVYCAAKGMPIGRWSNLAIDVSHGALGVEQKMICRPSARSILDACGTSIMHPAGTRAIRIPAEQDPIIAARSVLKQYGELIDERTAIVRVMHQFQHGVISRPTAIEHLVKEARMNGGSAAKMLPTVMMPIGSPDDVIDMRMGWLLWQAELREFLYFEEPMTKPNPDDFIAEWHQSGGGRRRASRNLWVYNRHTNEKLYSITTEAGAKVQPYFKVPPPHDPNLYHWIVQGEIQADGLVRVWLTPQTAQLLRMRLGNLSTDVIANAIATFDLSRTNEYVSPHVFERIATSILVPEAAYSRLKGSLKNVGDEYCFRQLIGLLE